MNYPTILGDQPLLDGVHCILYSPEPGELTRAICWALADKPRLEQIGMAAARRSHAHHTAAARAERVAVAAIGRRLDGSLERTKPNADGKRDDDAAIH